MNDIYLWLKAVHILAVISWMAGLFYLPRLYVYHAERGHEAILSSTFKVMERRLLKAIMRPAAAVVLLSGGWLIHEGGYFDPVPAWLWLKLACVAGMFAFHGLLEMHCVRFREDRERKAGKYFRMINEIPTVLLIGIVVFVVLKP